MSSFAGITSERSWSVRAVAWLKTPCGSSCRFRDQSCQTMRSGLVGVGNCASRYTPRASRTQFARPNLIWVDAVLVAGVSRLAGGRKAALGVRRLVESAERGCIAWHAIKPQMI